MGSSFQLGWASAQEAHAAERQRRQQLEDEARQLKVSDLYNQGNQLAALIPSLSGADRERAMGQLTDAKQGIIDAYHPIKAPGAVQRDWEFLTRLISRKPRPQPGSVIGRTTTTPEAGLPAADVRVPVEAMTAPGLKLPASTVAMTQPAAPAYQTSSYTPPSPAQMSKQQRQQVAQRDAARQQAEQAVAAQGTPEQRAESEMAAKMAQINIIDKLPGLSAEERQSAKQGLLYAAVGIPMTPKYFSALQTTTGPDGKIHVYRVPMDPRLDPEEINFGEGEQFRGGKAPKGMTYVKASDSVKDLDTGVNYFRGGPNNPPEANALFAGFDKTDALAKAFMIRLAQERGKGYNDSRRVNVIDTQTGKATVVEYSQFMKDPDRFVVASEYDKYAPRINMLEDLRGSSRIVRSAIDQLKAEGGFNWKSDAVTALQQALTDVHPQGAMQRLIATNALGTLTPDQQRYLIATASLIEQAMGMRSILGAGAGSDDVRKAITQTIPGLLTPSADFALTQMDVFDGVLERVHRMIPSNIKLQYNLGDTLWTVQDKPSPYSEIEQGGAGGGGGTGGAGGGGAGAGRGGGPLPPDTFRGTSGSRSLQQSMGALPGKSQAEVIQALHNSGYSYTLP